ncbi:MAG TPA: DUF3261 domain-containing protein [Fibrobacteria bacterium]|nr:DUF3261 domain-containing protein [Fibrobacteria bacterium]
MRAFRSLLIAAALPLSGAVLDGCALLQRKPEAWALPPLASGPPPGRWVQSLTLERRGRSLELVAVIENDGKTLTLAGLSPTGQRLVRISWTGGKVEQESDPNLPVRIDGESILRDVVFVNWPAPALAAVFAGTRWKARFDGADRTLAWGGRPWLSVRPDTGGTEGTAASGPGGGNGGDAPVDRVVVDHVAEGYQVHVATVERDSAEKIAP